MNPPTADSSAPLDTLRAAGHVSATTRTLVSHRMIAASPERIWSSLQCYEELDLPPPLLLKLFLPRPVAAVPTAPREIGRETVLRYAGGHYARRVVRLEPPHSYEFEVIEQRLTRPSGVLFLRGAFYLHKVDAEHTDLSITTAYSSTLRPRWLMQALESAICLRLQRHVLDAIARRALQN